ncbi:UNVERIFIED_CONTAM: hypothetical protein K2H54_045358 [Gekko kuhli]
MRSGIVKMTIYEEHLEKPRAFVGIFAQMKFHVEFVVLRFGKGVQVVFKGSRKSFNKVSQQGENSTFNAGCKDATVVSAAYEKRRDIW